MGKWPGLGCLAWRRHGSSPELAVPQDTDSDDDYGPVAIKRMRTKDSLLLPREECRHGIDGGHDGPGASLEAGGHIGRRSCWGAVKTRTVVELPVLVPPALAAKYHGFEDLQTSSTCTLMYALRHEGQDAAPAPDLVHSLDLEKHLEQNPDADLSQHQPQLLTIKAYPKRDFGQGADGISPAARAEAETTALRALCGVSGVPSFVEAFEDDQSNYVVMAACAGHTLASLIAANWLGCGHSSSTSRSSSVTTAGGGGGGGSSGSSSSLSEELLVADVLIPLLHTLAEVHQRGYVHRQVRPEHVVVRERSGAGGPLSAGLVGWGLAARRSDRCLHTCVGPLEYCAPEVLSKPSLEGVMHMVLYGGMAEEELPQYDDRADVWSLGVTMHEALTGVKPFRPAPTAELMLRRQMQTLQPAAAAAAAVAAGAGGGAYGSARRSSSCSSVSGLSSGRVSPEPVGLGVALDARVQAGLLTVHAASFLEQALQLDPRRRPGARELLAHPLVAAHWERFAAKHGAPKRRVTWM